MIDEPASPEPYHPYSPPQSPQGLQPRIRHSGVGIASFVIGLFAAVATLAIIAYAGYVEVSTPGGMDEKSPVAMLIGVLIFAAGGLLLLGIMLGGAGLFQSDRRKLFAWLGLLVNGFVLAGAVGIVMLGLSMAP
jgi:hypothetical protein